MAAKQGGGWLAVVIGSALAAPWLLGKCFSDVDERARMPKQAVHYESRIFQPDSPPAPTPRLPSERASARPEMMQGWCDSGLWILGRCDAVDSSSAEVGRTDSADAAGISFP
jgi:hypothetical protein